MVNGCWRSKYLNSIKKIQHSSNLIIESTFVIESDESK
jgi:hypothetical protein